MSTCSQARARWHNISFQLLQYPHNLACSSSRHMRQGCSTFFSQKAFSVIVRVGTLGIPAALCICLASSLGYQVSVEILGISPDCHEETQPKSKDPAGGILMSTWWHHAVLCNAERSNRCTVQRDGLSQSGTHPNQSLHWFCTCSYSLSISSQALRGAATLQRAALCSHNSFCMVWYVIAQSCLWNCCLIAHYQ